MRQHAPERQQTAAADKLKEADERSVHPSDMSPSPTMRHPFREAPHKDNEVDCKSQDFAGQKSTVDAFFEDPRQRERERGQHRHEPRYRRSYAPAGSI